MGKKKKPKYLSIVAAAAAIIAFSTLATAEIVGTPFQPEVDKRLHRIEAVEGDVTFSLTNSNSMSSSLRASPTHGLGYLKVAKAKFVLDGIGASSLSPTSTLTLPAKSVLIGGFLYNSVTIITSAGEPRFKVQCEDDANILASQILTTAQATITNTSMGRPFSSGGAAPVKSIAAACNVLGTVATGTFSQGDVNIFIEYITTD